MAKHKSQPTNLSRETVLAHLAVHPGDTKRDISRALAVRGQDRVLLKRILAQLADEGLLERGKKKSFLPPGVLPEMTTLVVVGPDLDGELIGRPAQWDADDEPPSVFIVPAPEDEAASRTLGAGDRVLARITRGPDGYEGRVVRQLGPSAVRQLGVLRREDGGRLRVEPIDRKTRHAFIVEERDRGGAELGELVAIEPISGQSTNPRARIVERLGSMSEPRTVSLIAIHAHGIPVEFPRGAIVEAESALPVSADGRTDLRRIPLITIDPEDARDHDDAVWAGPDTDPNNRGGHVVIVAIADVAHYVTPASGLDVEARKRGNSVYFPDRVVPMLPEALSADMCSLRENEDRATLAVRMVFNANGHKLRHEFIRGLMRSAAKLSYAQAQAAFDAKPDAKTAPLLDNVMKPLWHAYEAVARARDERSPLDLNLPERRIILGSNGKVESIAFRERLESMRLIEEFMILANVCAAETLEKARVPLIYRIHERPSMEKLSAFSDYLRTIDVSFAKGQVIKPATFNRILNQVKGGPHEAAMNEVVLRSQAQAVYAPENLGHFGLNLTHYAHFTSPIRRYADLIVHRALIRAGSFGQGGLNEKEAAHLHEIAEHISMTERRAMAAERESVDRYVAAFMEDRIGAVFQGRILGVTRFGLFVRLKETGADGLQPIRALGYEFFRHDEKSHALVGSKSGQTYHLGDMVMVKLAEAAPLTGGLRFDLAEDEAPSPGQNPDRGHRPGAEARRKVPFKPLGKGPKRGKKHGNLTKKTR